MAQTLESNVSTIHNIVRCNTWLKNKLADYSKWVDYNNADLIGEGFPPRDANGDPNELHHIGQQQDSPFRQKNVKKATFSVRKVFLSVAELILENNIKPVIAIIALRPVERLRMTKSQF